MTAWGGISSRGKTPIVFVDGTIDARNYCEILERYLLELPAKFPDGWRFQQDNEPSRSSEDHSGMVPGI